jgi:hypothetical protein
VNSNRAAISARRDAYEGFFRQVVDDGVRSGEFAPADPKMAAMLVLSAVNWLPQWYKPSGPLTADQAALRFSELILRGLAPRTF